MAKVIAIASAVMVVRITNSVPNNTSPMLKTTMEFLQKQFSAASERNREPILEQLRALLSDCREVLEIGSGTGQHAVYFAEHLPHLQWQTSDRLENHASIRAYILDAKLSNLSEPYQLDVGRAQDWPQHQFDAIFTANTCHIMAWTEVEAMFLGASDCLKNFSPFLIYGPFNYQGQFTSESNAAFDLSLRHRASHMGLRNIEDLVELANTHGFVLSKDISMPANNRLLVFQKTTNGFAPVKKV